ncbi:MAG TPA: hypothetical protein VFH26_01050 [Gemmatimonadales bacterium]|nr:hypothetical protein [Gemmatimonadales bacterium]
MVDLPFYWIFIAVAALVDLVGLFFLWQRRNSPVTTSHRPARAMSGRIRIPTAERRRRDRRDPGQAASA